VNRLLDWLPERPLHRRLALALLAVILLQRLLLILGQPDLLHDLDAGELKHLDLALNGLPDGGSLRERLYTYLSGPENIHHGGYPTTSVLIWLLSKLFGASLTVARLVPIGATVAAAALTAAWLNKRAGAAAALIALALFAGAPPLLLKWSCTVRGGHTEGILLAPLLLILLERARASDGLRDWGIAGAAAGFSVYFTYLALPFVGLLGLAAAAERWRGGAGWAQRLGALAGGAVIGFLPWIVGLIWIELPYLGATIHQSGNPDEAAEVQARTVLVTLKAALTALPHNLLPWGAVTADAAPYMSESSDMLDFTPTPLTWMLRAVVFGAATLGLVAAYSRRSAVAVVVAVLPAAHYLFAVRLAGNLAWPDVPHRYLVPVYPMLCASVGLGVAWLGSEGSARRRSLAGVVAGAVTVVAVIGMVQGAGWLATPSGAGAWDAARYRQVGIGQVRVAEADAMNQLLDSLGGEEEFDGWRGVGLIYKPISDYYLLFRPEHAPPYPDRLFSERDELAEREAQRQALVQGALGATRVRAAGDEEELRRLVCSWQPHPSFVDAARQARADAGITCP